MKQLFRDLGLSDKAVTIYLDLLSKGQSSVDDMAKSTGIKRTSLYPYVNELKKLELISWDEGVVGSALRITNLDKIQQLAQKKIQDAEKTALNLTKELPEIRAMYQINDPMYSIQKYVGVEEVRKALEIVYKYKVQKGYCGEFIYSDLGKKWYENHLKEMYKTHKIHDRVLFTEDAVKEISYSELKTSGWYDENMADYRYVPGLLLPKGVDVYILDDRVVTIYSEDQPVCTIVKSQKYRDYESGLFEQIWPQAIKVINYKNSINAK